MKFALISPATEIMPDYIDGAVAELIRRGHQIEVFPHARGPRSGTFAASDRQRLDDLETAVLDHSIDVILCARGGYGCVHLLSPELEEMVRMYPKWMIGFSDVSALHALWLKAGVPSIHASMAKQYSLVNPSFLSMTDHPEKIMNEIENLTDMDKHDLEFATITTLNIIDSDVTQELKYEWAGNPRNIAGFATGRIVGGNLAVLNGLAATPWDILSPEYLNGKILFLEDVGEKIYQVERMLKRLQLAGSLDAVNALIFGQFTDYRPDRNFESMENMISSRLKEWGILCPVVFNAPIGHIHNNVPIIEGAECRLDISAERTIIVMKNEKY
ncbi:MAG: LD-carboxypeptidase [Muribaculaceae bacterium]|nr:LD-carboxypeptidase [Muribaculaceae bacterium]